MTKILPLAAALAAAFLSATAAVGENLSPSIEGKSNGASLKYNQNCLDIAYKNAYGQASGKATSASDFSNYKCYVNKKAVPCTSMFEDSTTEQAEADYLFATASKVSGSVTVSSGPRSNGATATTIYGAAWFSGYSGSGIGSLTATPAEGIRSLYYDAENDRCGIDLSDLFQSLKTKYGATYNAENNNVDVSAKPVTVTVNGKSVQMTVMNYTPQEQLSGYANAKTQYTFQAAVGTGDVLGLKNLIGQTASFSVTW